MQNKNLVKIAAKVVLSIVVLAGGGLAWFFSGLGSALGGGTEPTTIEKFYQNIWIFGVAGIFLIFNKYELSRRIGYYILCAYGILLVIGYIKG